MTHFPEIVHNDHEIEGPVLEWVQNHPSFKGLETGSFVKVVLELPDDLPDVKCALYGPSVGDQPTSEDQVRYQERSDRPGKSRLIDKPTRPARRVGVIGLVGIKAFTMYGTNAEEVSPREPNDPTIPAEELEMCKKFWSEHALSSEQWTK